MTYRTILVHAEPAAAAQPRLAAAAAVAELFDASLIGLGAEMFDWIGVSDPYGITAADWLTVMRDQMQLDLVAAKTAFEANAPRARREWIELMEPPAPAMARLSRSIDLIIAGGAPLGSHPAARSADPATLAMTTGRPVLVAPPDGGSLQAKAVVVAWKDSREARRALSDSMPLLHRAEMVVVVEVCADVARAEAEARTADVANYLRQHGIEAKSCARCATPERVASELNGIAKSVEADLIVTGAFGHSRMAEWVLGGVTRDLLARPERFILLSH